MSVCIKALLVSVTAACATAVPQAQAQLRASRSTAEPLIAAETAAEDAAAASRQYRQFSLLPEDLRLRNAALIAGGALVVGAYGMKKWWNDGFSGRFRSQNEGWFGQDTSSGGADKAGHAFFNYAATRLFARGFEAVGNEPDEALNLGFWSTLGVMTTIEVVDGYSKRYRFSPQDAVMNLVGAGVGYLMEHSPALDRLVDFRLLYKPSHSSGYEPAGDYSGQTYLLVLKASGVSTLRTHEGLRYLELAFGYGTRGYEDPPGFDRGRNLYFGISLNLSELLADTVFRGEHGLARHAADNFFEFIQVPGTVALGRKRL